MTPLAKNVIISLGVVLVITWGTAAYQLHGYTGNGIPIVPHVITPVVEPVPAAELPGTIGECGYGLSSLDFKKRVRHGYSTATAAKYEVLDCYAPAMADGGRCWVSDCHIRERHSGTALTDSITHWVTYSCNTLQSHGGCMELYL